jgi:hypothetical protein
MIQTFAVLGLNQGINKEDDASFAVVISVSTPVDKPLPEGRKTEDHREIAINGVLADADANSNGIKKAILLL